MAINLDNLNAAFAKANKATSEISKISHSEMVPMDLIYPSEYNPYNEFDNDNDGEIIKQLADSIAVQGLIEPIVLNKISEDKYIILSGERRFKAVSLLNWRSVNAQVYDNLDKTTANLILHTSNLEVREYSSGQKLVFFKDVKTLLEEMKSSRKLTGGMQKAIANMLHVNERQVRKYERICNELSEDEQEQIINNEISINEGYKIAQERKNERTLVDKQPPTKQTVDIPTEKKNEAKKTTVEKSETSIINDYDENNNKADPGFSDFSLTSPSDELINIVFKAYSKNKLLTYYKMFIPTETEGINFLLSPLFAMKNAVVDKISKTLAIGNDVYPLSYIDTLIRLYIREENDNENN